MVESQGSVSNLFDADTSDLKLFTPDQNASLFSQPSGNSNSFSSLFDSGVPSSAGPAEGFLSPFSDAPVPPQRRLVPSFEATIPAVNTSALSSAGTSPLLVASPLSRAPIEVDPLSMMSTGFDSLELSPQASSTAAAPSPRNRDAVPPPPVVQEPFVPARPMQPLSATSSPRLSHVPTSMPWSSPLSEGGKRPLKPPTLPALAPSPASAGARPTSGPPIALDQFGVPIPPPPPPARVRTLQDDVHEFLAGAAVQVWQVEPLPLCGCSFNLCSSLQPCAVGPDVDAASLARACAWSAVEEVTRGFGATPLDQAQHKLETAVSSVFLFLPTPPPEESFSYSCSSSI